NGPGQKDEGHVRRGLGRNIEGGKPVEGRNGEVRQNEMRTEVAERLAKQRLGVHAVMNAANTTAFELTHGQFGFSLDVLDDQYAQVQWHPGLRGRSRYPPLRKGKLASCRGTR